MLPIPPTWLAAGGLALAVVGFAGGYKVRDWRCESQIAKIERKAVAAADRARVKGNLEAIDHELERADAEKTTTIREREIRTKYVPVPGTCEPGAAVTSVLDAAIRDANGRASGQPGAAVPEPS